VELIKKTVTPILSALPSPGTNTVLVTALPQPHERATL
jgi:hypothetical protein